jgi:hypothetical protein
MRRINFLAWSLLSIWLSACASFQVAGDIAHGRQALIAGDNQAALGYFQAAEQVDPAYIYGTELRQGVLSYRQLCTSPIDVRNGSFSEPER